MRLKQTMYIANASYLRAFGEVKGRMVALRKVLARTTLFVRRSSRS